MALINSLEIKNFKLFRDLHIKQLGRVNLIVGKNNVGKSTLLEALWLYANQGAPEVIRQILEDRREMVYGQATQALLSLRHLFYGRKDPSLYPQTILLKANGTHSSLDSIQINVNELVDFLQIAISGQPAKKYPVGWFVSDISPYKYDLADSYKISVKQNHCVYLEARGISQLALADLYNQVVATALEDYIVRLLQVIENSVERISLSTDATNFFTPLVKVKGMVEPVSLRTYGDGMYRIFGLGLALVNAKDGMLLVDEIENGLHYTVQAEVWRHIFALAHKLNIQVFATTHSEDCIKAFQIVSQEDKNEEAILINLESNHGQLVVHTLNEDILEIATRRKVEVR